MNPNAGFKSELSNDIGLTNRNNESVVGCRFPHARIWSTSRDLLTGSLVPGFQMESHRPVFAQFGM